MTKADLPGAEEVRQKLQASTGRNVLALSAATGQGMDAFLREVACLLQDRNVETRAN